MQSSEKSPSVERSNGRTRPRRCGETIGYRDRLSLGTVVVDSEQSPVEQDEAIVVSAPRKTISEWAVHGERTVADDNPNYDSDEWVTIVAFRDDLEPAFEYYSGLRPLRLSRLHEHNISFYAFPDSRLERVGHQRAHFIPLDRIFPSPLHVRSFSPDGNESYIDECRDRGFPVPYPTVRVRSGQGTPDTEFEVVDGHKRVYIGHVIGAAEIKCQVLYIDEQTAADRHLEAHFAALTPEQQTLVRDRAAARWPETYEELFP